MPARYDGLTFLEMKQMLWSAMREAFPTVGADKTAMETYLRVANAEVDARLSYSMGTYSTVTVADQSSYTLYDAPAQVLYVTLDGALLAHVSFQQLLEHKGTYDGSGTPSMWARFGDDLYLQPAPETAGEAIVVYMYQGPPLLSADDDVPAVPAQYHHAIVTCALSHLLNDIPGQENKASLYQQKFEAELAPLLSLGEIHREPQRIEPRREK
jgi:hypothetical protein